MTTTDLNLDGLENAVEKACRVIDRLRAELAEARAQAAQLRGALSTLAFMARTSGGTAGPDLSLMDACERAEALIAKSQSPSTTGEAVTFDSVADLAREIQKS